MTILYPLLILLVTITRRGEWEIPHLPVLGFTIDVISISGIVLVLHDLHQRSR